MPLICRELVELLDTGPTSSLNRSSLSNYAFLYGAFPTAPSVAIYAAHYGMELDVVRPLSPGNRPTASTQSHPYHHISNNTILGCFPT